MRREQVVKTASKKTTTMNQIGDPRSGPIGCKGNYTLNCFAITDGYIDYEKTFSAIGIYVQTFAGK